MNELVATVAAALAAGLAGSAHCVGMCGGISGLYAARSAAASLRGDMPLAASYNAGRLLSYTALGVVAGVFGSSVLTVAPATAVLLRFAAAAVIILIGIQIAFQFRPLALIEAAGGRIWQSVAPMARTLLPVTSPGRAVRLGLLWGLLPCGLVYSALLIAATTGSAAGGGLVMLAFGAGTLPSMLTTGLGAATLASMLRRRSIRLGLGLLVIGLGLATAWMPVSTIFETSGAHSMH